MRFVSLFVIFTSIFTTATYAGQIGNQTSINDFKALMFEAKSKTKPVRLKLKPHSIVTGDINVPDSKKGVSLVGRVAMVGDDSVTIEDTIPGRRTVSLTIKYQDIDSAKYQPPVARVFSGIGKGALFGGELILFVPLYLILLPTGLLPSC